MILNNVVTASWKETFAKLWDHKKEYTHRITEMSKGEVGEERRKGSNPDGATYIYEVPFGEPCEMQRDVSELLSESSEAAKTIPCWDTATYDYHGRLYCASCFKRRVSGTDEPFSEEKLKAAIGAMQQNQKQYQQRTGIGSILGGLGGGLSGALGGAPNPFSTLVQPGLRDAFHSGTQANGGLPLRQTP